MIGRNWLIALLMLAAIGWWYSPVSPRIPPLAAPVVGTSPNCPPPPRVNPGAEPLQTPVPSSLTPIRLQAATLTPLAGFSIDARVLSRADYNFGREAALSPTDLALGWGRMGDEAVLSKLEINQSGRWYHYRWRDDPPLPPPEMSRSSANMHLIPADTGAARSLRDVREGERVRIDGWLVEAQTADGWRWRSSTSRTDTGAGGCEVIYVCSITVMR